MPRELEYHLRAILSGFTMAVAIAYWNNQPHDKFWGDFAATVLLCYIAALMLLWWRGPENTATDILEPLRKLLDTIYRKLTNNTD